MVGALVVVGEVVEAGTDEVGTDVVGTAVVGTAVVGTEVAEVQLVVEVTEPVVVVVKELGVGALVVEGPELSAPSTSWVRAFQSAGRRSNGLGNKSSVR